MTSIARKGLDACGHKTVKEAELQALELMKMSMTRALFYRLMRETDTPYDNSDEFDDEEYSDLDGTPERQIWEQAQDMVEDGLDDSEIESHYQYNYFIIVNSDGEYAPMMGPIIDGKPVKTSEDGMSFIGQPACTAEQLEEYQYQFEDDATELLEALATDTQGFIKEEKS